MAVSEMVGKKEATEILGVSNAANLFRDVPELPEPVQRVAATPLWERKTLEALAAKRKKRNPRHGRPRGR